MRGTFAVEGDLADKRAGHETHHNERVVVRPRHLGPHDAREQHEHLPRLRALVHQHFAGVQGHTPELAGKLGSLAEGQQIVEELGAGIRSCFRPA